MNPIAAWTIAFSAVLILTVCWYIVTPAMAIYFNTMTDDLGVEGPSTFISAGLVAWNLMFVVGILGFLLWAILSSHEKEYESGWRRMVGYLRFLKSRSRGQLFIYATVILFIFFIGLLFITFNQLFVYLRDRMTWFYYGENYYDAAMVSFINDIFKWFLAISMVGLLLWAVRAAQKRGR